MLDSENKPKHVVVIGAGITGLSVCWYLQTQSETPLEVTLIESSHSLGGKMITSQINGEEGKFIIDAGPELFVTRKPEAWELALELGLEDQIIDPGSETKNMYVLDDGRPKKIPLSLSGFIFSDLLSIQGKLRMIIEPFIAPKMDYEDEALADFVTRRLGKEALDKMIGPVLAGIYNTDPDTQSIMTTSPVMREMEMEHGGLFKGALARIRSRKKKDSNQNNRPQFMTFKDGSQVMVDALEAQLAIRILRGTKAISINKNTQHYQVNISGQAPLQADAIICSTPGNQASKLLSDLDADSAQLIGKIAHENIGTATLIFNSDQFEMPYKINGLMIPRREKRRIDAVTWTTNKPIKRAPEGYEMLRVFFGGSDPSVVNMKPDEIIEVILAELNDIFGLTAIPVKTAVFCWPESFPQAHVGHLELVEKIEAQLPQGFFVAGSSYRGIGIPDCVRQARDIAHQVIKFIG